MHTCYLIVDHSLASNLCPSAAVVPTSDACVWGSLQCHSGQKRIQIYAVLLWWVLHGAWLSFINGGTNRDCRLVSEMIVVFLLGEMIVVFLHGQKTTPATC